MRKCTSCGAPAGFLMSMCAACLEKPSAQEVGPLRQLTEYFEGGWVSRFLLCVGQLMAGLTCLAIPYTLLVNANTFRHLHPEVVFTILLGSILQFGLNVALPVVFKRARSLARLVEQQAVENQLLWEAIRSLQKKNGPPPDPATMHEGPAE